MQRNKLYFCWPTYLGSNCWSMLQATWHNVTQHTVNVSIDLLRSVVGTRLLSKNMKFPGSSDLDLLDLYLWIRYCEYKISSFDWSNISSVVVIMREQLQRTDGVHPTAVSCHVCTYQLTKSDIELACLHALKTQFLVNHQRFRALTIYGDIV